MEDRSSSQSKQRTGPLLLTLLGVVLSVGCGVEDVVGEGVAPRGVRISLGGQDVVTITDGQVVGGFSMLEGQATDDFTVMFTDASGGPLDLPPESFSLAGEVADLAIAGFTVVRPFVGRVEGRSGGATNLVLSLIRSGETIYSSPPIPISVTA